jgi:hypothetical protein
MEDNSYTTMPGYMVSEGELPYSIAEIADRILTKVRYGGIRVRQRSLEEILQETIPVYSHPVDMTRWWISQYFGDNPSSYKPLLGHDGLDYACNVGTKGMCPSGTLDITKLIQQTNSYGRHIWGKDEYGHTHIFGHVHEWLCSVGDRFTRGQVFFTTGGNLDDHYHGYSTGPHLHWELRPTYASISNGYAGAVNQLPFVTYGAVAPIDVPVPEPLFWVIVNTDQLIIRTTPKIPALNNNKTGEKLAKGTRIPIYGEYLDGRVFGKISKTAEKYACLLENTTVHMSVEISDAITAVQALLKALLK